jgi:hypothetical protein
MLGPYWLTGLSIDEIEGEALAYYDKVRQEYMCFLKIEKRY